MQTSTACEFDACCIALPKTCCVALPKKEGARERLPSNQPG